MLSTVTAVLFFSPHSLMYLSLNHLSKAGTKCTHWMILRVFFAAALWDFGAKIVGPRPAPSAPAVVVLMKSRRVIGLPAIASLPSMSNARCLRDLNLFVAMMEILFFHTRMGKIRKST